MELHVFFSYACRDTWKVFSWLDGVSQQEPSLSIRWHPFAVEIQGDEEWSQPWQTARSELRGFIAAEAARQQGEAAFQRFHALLERAVHEQYLELGSEKTIVDAARQANLAMEGFQTALHNPKMAELAQQSHRWGLEHLQVFGTPTLVFPQERSVYLELAEMPPVNDSLSLFQALEMFARQYPSLRQFKRTI